MAFEKDDRLPTDQLLHRLQELPEAPWNSIRGKPLDDRGLAGRLRKYEIRPKTVRIGDHTPRGYERADFADAWGRYFPPLSAQ